MELSAWLCRAFSAFTESARVQNRRDDHDDRRYCGHDLQVARTRCCHRHRLSVSLVYGIERRQ